MSRAQEMERQLLPVVLAASTYIFVKEAQEKKGGKLSVEDRRLEQRLYRQLKKSVRGYQKSANAKG